MRRQLGWMNVAVVLALLLCPACDDDDYTVDPVPVDTSGTWSFTASPSDPPRTMSCTGDLVGTVWSFCDFFVLSVTQAEDAFSGAAAIEYCGAAFSVSGTVTGSAISGTFVSSDDVHTYRLFFSGVVSENAMIVAPVTFTVDGLSGACSMAGEYWGERP